MITHQRLVVALVAMLALAAVAEAEGPPWGASLAEGKKLPLPFGVGLTVYHQDQEYALDSLSIGIPGFDSLPLDRIAIDNQLTELNLKLDLWVLPFLNVFALYGDLDGKTDVDFSQLALPFPLGRIAIEYGGNVLGGGLTLAGGGDRWFGSLTGVLTESDLTGDFDSSASSFVAMPRVGMYGERGAIWIGAMYQTTEEEHRGTIGLPFVGPVPFDVTLKQQDEWNALAGIHAAIAEHWTIEVEGGFGARQHATMTIDYRF